MIHRLVVDLARFEKLEDDVAATPTHFADALSRPAPACQALLAEAPRAEPAGFALFAHTFSTFTGRRTLWLEDLYVAEAWRGAGVGLRLLRALAARARTDGCARMEWMVLDWNAAASRFYDRLGARPVDGWRRYRLMDPALSRLGATA